MFLATSIDGSTPAATPDPESSHAATHNARATRQAGRTGQRLFELGAISATPAARDLLDSLALGAPLVLLNRHAAGDWGDVDQHDKNANDRDLVEGGRLVSAYNLPGGRRVWVITEADRSRTTFLLPEEY